MIFDPSDLENYRAEPLGSHEQGSCVACVIALLAAVLIAAFFWMMSA